MSSTYTSRLKLEKMVTGANANTWGTRTNNNLDVVDAFSGGYLSKSVAGSSNVTLTTGDADPSAEAANKIIELTGALTGAISVFLPAVESEYVFFNNTSGSHNLKISATGHDANGTIITQGAYTHLYCDGASNFNVEQISALAPTTDFKGAATFSAGATVASGQDLVAGGSNITLRSNGQVQATLFTGSGAGLTGVEPFAAGTKMVFYQASAPTGWTQDTATELSNASMAVVTGTGGGTGGSDSFFTTFGTSRNVDTTSATVSVSGSVGSTTLSTPQIPSHSHPAGYPPNPFLRGTPNSGGGSTGSTGGTGGGGSHSHPFTVSSSSLGGTISMPNMDIKFANVIIAAKDS